MKYFILFSLSLCFLSPQIAQAQRKKKSSLDVVIESVNKNIKVLANRHYVDSLFAVMKADTNTYKIEAFNSFLDQINTVCDYQQKLQFINPDNMQLCLDQTVDQCIVNQDENRLKIAEIREKLPHVRKGIYSFESNFLAEAKKIIELQGDVMLNNPLLDMDKILVSYYRHGDQARKVMASRLGMPVANYSSMFSAYRKGIDASIVELSNLRGEVQVKELYRSPNKENIADLQMHWDADRALFSSVDKNNSWSIYELDFATQKKKEIVNLPEDDLEFCDPNYLPDGRIILASNVGVHGVPCVHGSDVVGNLSLYNPKDESFRRLTFDQDGNWNPVVMNNGRVMYTRWEYTDLTHYFSRIVMHMNPDGTENKALYGSGSYFPNSTFDMRPLPGQSSQFVGIISGHHGVARAGRLIVFDPQKGRKEETGMLQEIPFKNRKIDPIIKDYLVDGVWPLFVRPYPLSEDFFLVSAKLHPGGLWGIYLVDVYDNVTCIAEFEGIGLNMPIPMIKTECPPVIPDRVNLKDKEGTIFIQDIYHGEGTQGVPRGTIKEVRVFAYEYAYIKSISDHDAQGIQSGWDIKRLLGTVPVEEDGSVIFKAPANTPISLQPLDENGAAIQWMRSWFTPMPGETISCVGCHEDQNQIPIPKRVKASQIKPHKIKQPEGGVRSFTYENEIQPILDRACISCHNGEKASPNLMGNRYEQYKRGNYTKIDKKLSKSYLDLMPYVYRQGPEAEIYVLTPYEYHASNSELIQILKKDHHGLELTDKEWKTLYNWIDFNAPYDGAFNSIREYKGHDQYTRRIELTNKYGGGAGVDWRKEIEAYATSLKPQTAVMPKQVKPAKMKEVKAKGWPFDKDDAIELQKENAGKTKSIKIAPEMSIDFVWIPAGSFVQGNNHGASDEKPAFKVKIKKGFWMSKSEITNEQYRALVPHHDSRFIGQYWKDHTTPGYTANKPKQPVIRVSQEGAMEYGHLLSEKMGLNITLPSESEWEWACRGGNESDFWYGNSNTDFSQFENMADKQLSKMAVVGVNPRPMSANDPMRKFWDFLLRENSVDDKNMISAEVGQYAPNVWGLYDMHGNVAEWTCSAYVPYPLGKEMESKEFIVRGGSWIERPKSSTSSARKAFLPWQKPYHVGFRLIIK